MTPGSPLTTIYFWGCWSDAIGHHLWRPMPTRYEPCRHNGLVPWPDVDGALCPGADECGDAPCCDQVEGAAAIHHCDGWTALAWWDRSVDSRYGSNAALFASGTHDFAAMMALGKQYFPGIMVRFRYKIAVVTQQM